MASNNRTIKTVSFFFFLLMLSSCFDKKPPKRKGPTVEPIAYNSKIAIPINIDLRTLEKSILDDLDHPIAKGKTDRIDVNILATEQISEEELIKELVKPYTPGYYKKVWRTHSKTVRESYGCWLNPLKWGKCWKNVVKQVKKSVDVYVEPQEAIYRYVSKPVAKLIDKVYDTGGWINYKVYLDGFNMEYVNNQLITKATFKTKLSLDYEQAAVPLGPKIKLKGALTCTLESDMTIKANVRIMEDLSLSIDIIDDANLEFTKICVPGAVEYFDIVSYLKPTNYLIIDQLDKLIDSKLTDAIKSELNDSREDLNFKNDIKESLRKIATTKEISENLWLSVKPKKAYVGQLKGTYSNNRNYISTQIGLIADVGVIYNEGEPKMKKIQADKIPIELGTLEDESVFIVSNSSINYDFISVIAKESLQKIIDEKYASYDIKIGETNVYPSYPKFVASVEIRRKKNNKKLITLYYWGDLTFDKANKIIELRKGEFTAETKKKIINKSLDYLSEGFLEEKLSKIMKFDVSKDISELENSLQDVEVMDEFGVLKAEIKLDSLTNFSLGSKQLSIYGYFQGKAKYLDNESYKTFDIALKESEEIMKTLVSSSLDKLTLDVNEKAKFISKAQSEPKNILSGNSSLNIISNMSFAAPINNFSLMKLNNSVSKDSRVYAEISSPFVSVGDEIHYTDEDGKDAIRMATVKDANKPGDTVFVDVNGELKMLIMKNKD